MLGFAYPPNRHSNTGSNEYLVSLETRYSTLTLVDFLITIVTVPCRSRLVQVYRSVVGCEYDWGRQAIEQNKYLLVL